MDEMSEDQDLLARIGHLAGHINLHKAQTPPNGQNESSGSPPFPIRHRIAATVRSAPWKSTHRTSYPRRRARAGKSASNPHRNRTLILNKTTNTPHDSKDFSETPTGLVENIMKTDYDDNDHGLINSATSWVAKRDRHMQLINSSIFEKESQLRSKAMDATRLQKAQQKDLWEKHKIEMHLQSLSAPTSQLSTSSLVDATSTAHPAHQITINGLPFQVINGGSKLFRIRNADESVRSTPKKVDVGGVVFFRSRNGNLYRSGVVKASSGACGNKTCHLPHVDRAGQIRKHAAKTTDITKLGFVQESGGDSDSDLLSEEEDIDEIDSDDVDSDGLEDNLLQPSYNTANQTLSQQQDFVHF